MTTETVKEINDRWIHRRMMAWLAMISLLIIAFASAMLPGIFHESNGILMTVLTSLTAIVMGYMGLATYDDVKCRRGKSEATPENEEGMG